MNKARRFTATTVVAVLVIVAAACSSSGSKNTPTSGSVGAPGKILRTAFSEDISSLDPDNNFEVAGLGMLLSIYQGLLTYAPGSTHIEGQLAQSWTASSDAKTFKFTLRKGVKFHDGSVLTSANVKQSFERRIAHQDLATGYFLGDVASLTTPDPQTVVIVLKHPNFGFLDSLCSPWGPKVIGPEAFSAANAGSDFSKTWLSTHEDGSGPYQLTSYKRGTAYELKRFTGYWGQAPYFNGYDIKIVPSVSQQILQVRAGQLDFIDQYPFEQLNTIPSSLKVLSWSTLAMELAIVNPHRLPNVNTRKAIAAAINPTQWVAKAYGSYASPPESNYAKSMLTPGTPWAYPTVASTPKTNVPSLTVAYASDDVSYQSQVSDQLIARLQSVGIKATARVLPTDAFNNTAKNPSKGPDISLVHFYPDDAFPGSLSYLVFQCGTPLNYLGYCNKRADGLFADGFTNPDPNARNTDFLSGAKIGFDDAAFLGLMDLKDIIVYRPGLTNLVTYPALPWNFNYALARAGS